MITPRPLDAADVEAALAVEQAVYRQPWTARVFADELAAPNRRYLAIDVDGELAAYGGVMLVGDEAHVTTLVVAPPHRQGRLGTRLMLALVEAAVEEGARSLTLEVRRSNEAAQALYRRFGMAPVGVRKQYYRDEDALIMWAHDIGREAYGARLRSIREAL